MGFEQFDFAQHAGLAMLVAGVFLCYVASRAGVDALVGPLEASPGRRAIAHALPMGAVALIATALGHADLAIAVLLGGSVASASLAVGATLFTAEEPIMAAASWRRAWPFVLPVATLVFFAGFAGHFRFRHAIIFLSEGLAILWLWNGRAEPGEVAMKPRGRRPVALILAAILAAIGGWVVVRGGLRLGLDRSLPISTVGAAMIGPMLVLPMLGSGALLASRKLGGAAVTAQIGVVFLNLCVFLPLVIAGFKTLPEPYHAAPATMPTTHPATAPSTAPDEEVDAPEAKSLDLVFPVLAWRVDLVALMILGALFLPPAFGNWNLSRRDGAMFLAIYLAYLIIITAAARQ